MNSVLAKGLTAAGLLTVMWAACAAAGDWTPPESGQMGRANGNTIEVDSLADGSDPAACTLRDAVRSANEDTAHGGCQSGQVGQDTIVFSVNGEIVLTAGVIAVTEDLIISGPGAGELTVNGNQIAAIFDIDGANAGQANDVHIADLTLTNAGDSNLVGTGAIFAQGVDNLVLEHVHLIDNQWKGLEIDFRASGTAILNSVISGNNRVGVRSFSSDLLVVHDTIISANAGGGVWSAGDLHVFDSQITNNLVGSITSYGGVTVNGGELVLHDSVVSANAGDSVGAGVWFEGFDLDIQRTTIAGNQTDSSGGGAFIRVFSQGLIADSAIHGNTSGAEGGGLMLRQFSGPGSEPALRIVNTTISGNQAPRGGGVYVHRQAFHLAHLEHVTIVDNTATDPVLSLGGGISFRNDTGTIRLFNSVVADNQAADGNGNDVVAWTSAEVNPAPGDVDTGEELELDYTLVTDANGFAPTGTGNLFGDDPLLGPLGDNGGPTVSHHPQAASPLLNAGDPAFAPPPEHDQRGPGFPRVLGGRTDMGAIEADFDRLFDDRFEEPGAGGTSQLATVVGRVAGLELDSSAAARPMAEEER